MTYKIYYLPVDTITDMSMAAGTKVVVDPSGYTGTGFTVDYYNAPDMSVLTINYMAM